MNGDPFSSPDPDPGDAFRPEDLFREAEEARHKQIWEKAIRAYQRALKEAPGDVRLRLGLGRAYEGKSRDNDAQAFLLLAMEQYRLALQTDPRSQEAHDALLAATAKTDGLEDLLKEYRARLAKNPADELCRAAIRKMETLLLLRVKPPETAAPQASRFTWFLMERLLPVTGLGLVLGSVLTRIKAGSPMAHTLEVAFLRSGAFFLALFLVYKLLLRR